MKNKNIIILQKEIGNYDTIVYAINYMNPLSNLADLEDSLAATRVGSGYVLVDLLLCNGNNFNRFAQFYYDGDKITRSTIDIAELRKKEEIFVNDFYKGHKSVLAKGVLTPREYMQFVK